MIKFQKSEQKSESIESPPMSVLEAKSVTQLC